MFARKKNLPVVVSDGKSKLSEAVEGLQPYAGQMISDLRSQVADLAAHVQEVGGRRRRKRSHKLRNLTFALTGLGTVVAAVPGLRKAVLDTLRKGTRLIGGAGSAEDSNAKDSKMTSFEEQIVVAVPVSTAYSQWTQFEEFPKFMEGVDEVRQIDDNLLHWAATVAGRKAEWEARITDQETDRRIAWESVDGKHTSGAVTFEPAGASGTLIHLDMSYSAEGAAEKVGAAVGLDSHRVRGDLERFRDLIESGHTASGAWRGGIPNGETKKTTNRKRAIETPDS